MFREIIEIKKGEKIKDNNSSKDYLKIKPEHISKETAESFWNEMFSKEIES